MHFKPNDIICSQGLFWTCANQTPTFQGCCDADHDPCGGDGSKGGCPASKLHPMKLAHPQIISTMPQTSTTTNLSFFLTATSTGFTSMVLTSSAYSTTSTTGPSGTLDSTSSTQTSSPDTPNPANVPAIAGGVGGAVLVLLLALFFLWRCKRRNRRQSPYAYPQSPIALAEEEKYRGYTYGK